MKQTMLLLGAMAVGMLTLVGTGQQPRGISPQLPMAVGRAGDDPAAGKMFRVQLMLLGIGEKAQHPRLDEWRTWAQEGKTPAGVFAAADEIVAAGAGTVLANPVGVYQHDRSSRTNDSFGNPATLEYKDAEGKKVVIHGIESVQHTVELTVNARDGGVAVNGRSEFNRDPMSSQHTPPVAREENYQWVGSWNGRAPAEVIVAAGTPRKSGITGSLRPSEWYLLMRVVEVE